MIAVIVGATALALAAVGLVLNAHFAASLGQTGLAAVLLAAIGLAMDVLAVTLPTAASRLWQARHQLAALTAWLIWAGALVMMMLAGIGFASTNIGDAVAGRAKLANESVALNARLERLRDERAAISEHRSVEALAAELQRATFGTGRLEIHGWVPRCHLGEVRPSLRRRVAGARGHRLGPAPRCHRR
jgi:hypothetical protein